MIAEAGAALAGIEPDFALSVYEFDVLWHELNLGRVPYPLNVPSIGRTVEQREQLAAEVRRELDDRGLIRGQEVDAALTAQLTLLARSEISVEAVGHIGYPVRALAAAREQAAVLAVLAGGEIWLRAVRPDLLAGAAVAVLPAAAAGLDPEEPLSVPCRELAEAVERLDRAEVPFDEWMRVLPALVRAGLSRVQAWGLLELANHRVAGGQFGATAAGNRSVAVVNWFDTGSGRYLMVADGDQLTITPADSDQITQQVAAVLENTTAR